MMETLEKERENSLKQGAGQQGYTVQHMIILLPLALHRKAFCELF